MKVLSSHSQDIHSTCIMQMMMHQKYAAKSMIAPIGGAPVTCMCGERGRYIKEGGGAYI